MVGRAGESWTSQVRRSSDLPWSAVALLAAAVLLMAPVAGAHGFSPEGASRGILEDQPSRSPGDAGSADPPAPQTQVPAGHQDDDCLEFVPRPAHPAGLVQGWEPLTLEVAFAVDTDFTELHDDWEAVARDHIQGISDIYEEETDVAVDPVHVVQVPDGALNSASTSGTLEDLRAYYDEHYPNLDRDAVYLFSGGSFSNAAGQAECIAGAGNTDQAYAVGEADPSELDFLGLTFFPDKAVKIATHEIGHLLGAHHHQANCVETATDYDPRVTFDACTLMINDWGLINPNFSTANKLVTRGHVEHIQ